MVKDVIIFKKLKNMKEEIVLSIQSRIAYYLVLNFCVDNILIPQKLFHHIHKKIVSFYLNIVLYIISGFRVPSSFVYTNKLWFYTLPFLMRKKIDMSSLEYFIYHIRHVLQFYVCHPYQFQVNTFRILLQKAILTIF